MKANLPITACKQYCLAPAHAGQHKATSPTREPLWESALRKFPIFEDQFLKNEKEFTTTINYCCLWNKHFCSSSFLCANKWSCWLVALQWQCE